MSANQVFIHLGKLVSPELTVATKLVWLGLKIEPRLKNEELRSPTRLQRRIGVSRPTVRKALAVLDEKRWCRPQLDGILDRLWRIQVKVNPNLIADTEVPATARILYCLLQGLVKVKGVAELKSYEAIAKAVRLQPRTVSRAIRALVNAGWLAISRKHPRAPICFSFPDPRVAWQRAKIRRAEQRLAKAKYKGEALALLWCDELVADKHFEDDHFPKALTNPTTNELMQADRYYFDHAVAIEFNGPQHEGPTLRFPRQVALAQMERDETKRGICQRQSISLITLRPEDLTFERMRGILSPSLPMRNVHKDEPIIKLLERESQEYIEFITNLRRHTNRQLEQPVAMQT